MPKIWDVDGNGSVSAFGDLLMILKYSLGQRGNDLTNSGTLIDVGATRTTNAAIEGYIGMIIPYLDVNGDGLFDFNDAYLALLYKVGFRGASLIGSRITAGSTRTTSDEIVAYADKMVTDNP